MRLLNIKAWFAVLAMALAIPAFASDRGSTVLLINRVLAQQTVAATPLTLSLGSTITISTSLMGVPKGTIPSGTIVFSLSVPGSGTPTVSSPAVTIAPNGTASWSTTTIPIGTYTVSAAYSGDQNYLPSTVNFSSPITVTGTPDFNLSLPSTLLITQGSTGNATVTVTGVNGFQGDVELTCSGLMDQMTCALNPATVHVAASPASSTMTITTAATTVTTLSGLGLLLLGFRTRRKVSLLALCLVALGAIGFAVTGCGGPMYQQRNGTPPGSYSLTVTGTSGSLTHAEVITVIVK